MRWKKTLVISTILLTTLAAAGTAPAATSHTRVVHPGESIQAAVDASSPGDTVAVEAGTYHESVAIQTNRLTLRAVGRVTLRPPRDGKGRCNAPGEAIGICVVPGDVDFNTGEYTHRIRGVTVSGLRVVGFEGDGVFGFGSRNFRVSSVRAKNDTGYGVASFDGIGSTFVDNAVSGSEEAGLYVGDSPTARALVARNRTWDNQFGVLVRHTHDVAVVRNRVHDNCLGVFLLDDGQPGGSADNAVLGNQVRRNNHRCAVEEVPNTPFIRGGGIVAAGSQHNLIARNVVRGNRGHTRFSGGIVLVATPAASADGSFSAATHNLVIHNRASRNRPADLVEDRASSPNRFVDNRCRTSAPGGLCGHGTHHG